MRGARIVALAVGFTLISACAPHAPLAPAPSLRIAVAIEPRSLNPIFNDALIDVENINHLYNDPLWTHDARGTLVPRLAARVPTRANGDVSADGRTIVVRLRHDVRWQDGAPFTSDDVRFSWQTVMDDRNNVGSRDGVDQVERIDLPDRFTAVIHLRRRYAAAIPAMLPEMIPAHLLRGVAMATAPFDAAPIGTGPFRVVAWKRGDRIELVANDAYFGGKPALRRVSVLFVAGVSTRAVMLQTGEADLAELDRDAYRQLADDPNVTIVVAPKRAFSAFFVNVTRPLLRDVRVRRALAYALDRAAIVRAQSFARDRETLANGYASPASFAYDPQLPALGYDPRRAERLLDAAGWHAGRDGIRVHDGTRLTLQLAQLAGATDAAAVGTYAQAMWRAVGIDVQMKSATGELIFAPVSARGVLATGVFDLYFDTYTTFFDPDSSWLLTCERAEPRGFNESRYCDAGLDALERAALAAPGDATRRADYARIDRIVRDAVPLIFLSWPDAVFGMNPRVGGFSYNGLSDTWNAFAWHIR